MEFDRGPNPPAAQEIGPVSVPSGAAESGQLPAEASLGKRFWNVRTLISFVVAFAVLILLFTRAQIDPVVAVRAILGASPGYYLVALVVYYLVFPIRGLRWRQMLVNSGCRSEEIPGVGTLGEIIFVSWFVNCLVPAKLGDVYRAYLLKRRSVLSGSMAGGTIVAERLLDVTTLILLAGTAGLIALWGQRDKLVTLVLPLEIVSAVILVAALGLVALRLWSGWLRGLLPPQFHGLYVRFVEGAFGAFGSFHVLLPLSLFAWLAEAGRFYFVVRALGFTLVANQSLELAVVVAVALVGSLLTVVPLPGGLGIVQFGILGALVLFGVNKDEAASIMLLDMTLTWGSLVVFGLIAFGIGIRRGDWSTR